MSRKEDFKSKEEEIKAAFKYIEDLPDGNIRAELMENMIKVNSVEMLMQIAESLAVIADALSEINYRQALEK